MNHVADHRSENFELPSDLECDTPATAGRQGASCARKERLTFSQWIGAVVHFTVGILSIGLFAMRCSMDSDDSPQSTWHAAPGSAYHYGRETPTKTVASPQSRPAPRVTFRGR
jgi:hypothetical protein